MDNNYTVKRLGPGDNLSDAFTVRLAVFAKEQGFSPELEIDATDPEAHHVVLYEGTRPVATARVFPQKDAPGVYIIGRVAVLADQRGGTGRYLMEQTEQLAVSLGAKELRLGAQCQVQGFYEKLGYTAFGDVYYDEFCPHIYMQRQL